MGFIEAHRESDHIHHERDPRGDEEYDELQHRLRDYDPFPDRCWNVVCVRLRDASTDLSTVPATAANLIPDTAANLVPDPTTSSESQTQSIAAANFVSDAATNAGSFFAFRICVTTGDRQSGTLTM